MWQRFHRLRSFAGGLTWGHLGQHLFNKASHIGHSLSQVVKNLGALTWLHLGDPIGPLLGNPGSIHLHNLTASLCPGLAGRLGLNLRGLLLSGLSGHLLVCCKLGRIGCPCRLLPLRWWLLLLLTLCRWSLTARFLLLPTC